MGHASPQGSWSQAVTLLADINHPECQEDMVSDWQPAHSLVGDVVSEAEIKVTPLHSASGCHALSSLTLGRAVKGSQLALLCYSLGHDTLFCEH